MINKLLNEHQVAYLDAKDSIPLHNDVVIEGQ